MASSDYVVWSYLIYLTASVILTIWVARTLHANGGVFLVDTLLGDEKLAASVNHLLVVGFYLINIGYVTLALKEDKKPLDLQTSIECVSSKVGEVLIVLGIMHFFNLYVLSRIRRRGALRNPPTPVTPQKRSEAAVSLTSDAHGR